MSKKPGTQEAMDILSLVLLPQLSKSMHRALSSLEQVKNDYIQINNGNGANVKRSPIFSALEAEIQVESAMLTLDNIKRLLREIGAAE